MPANIPSKPGAVIKDTKVAAPGINGTAYRIMYTSENEQGKVVAVSGLVFVPKTPPPPGGYREVAWSHGTNGMTNQCAPSLSPSQAVPSINALLDKGWEVTASDYQGEGTPPGVLAYLVGGLAAENSIDLVRAVQHVALFHASPDYVVWGHSEGGQTAMFAWYIGPSYAPSLHMAGVVAGAPPSQFKYIYAALKSSPYAFYLYMAAIGFNEAYGNAKAPLSEVTTPQALKLVGLVKQGCYNYLQQALDKYPTSTLVTHDPFTVPAWKTLLEANDPGAFTAATKVPLLMIQGTADGQIPPISTQLLATHLCAIGAEVQRWMYPGQHHAQVIGPSTPDMVNWIADRFAGQPTPDPYVPHGQPNVLAQDCATPGGFTTPAP
ncbi:MAG: alpha/beta hydrolase [Actinomycetota bacterium]|nr:alpha/beta hydrolase [Actinomycetota bacterium]